MKSLSFVWIHRFKRWLSSSDFDQINEQSFIRLNGIFLSIEKTGDLKYQYIEKQLKKLENSPDWNTVKLVELLLIPFLDECKLDVELHYQLHKAQTLFSDSEYDFFMRESKLINGEPLVSIERKRALLSQLMESLHTYYEDRQLRSIFANNARLKIGLFFCVAIFFNIFLLTVSILYPDGIYQYYSDFYGINQLSQEPDTNKVHIHYAVTALMAGGMGACFSMLISLKSRIESVTLQELENIHSLHFIVTRIITGIGAALICYYFFRAGILSGSLFPDFQNKKEISLNSRSFFTLIIWCFIAGFSEKLVPSILSKTEAQVDKK